VSVAKNSIASPRDSIVVDGLTIKGWSRIARLASMVDNLLTENQIGLCTNQAMNAET
jgi:hypothetical protein